MNNIVLPVPQNSSSHPTVTETDVQNITHKVSNVTDYFYSTSKDKYDHKVNLIIESNDMSTQEKLDALDQSYDRHSREVWHGILVGGAVTYGLVRLACGDASMIKSVRHLIS